MLLKKGITQLESMTTHFEKYDNHVSKAGVAWHIDHSLKVIIGVCNAIKKSDPANYKWKFNLARLYVFTMNSFPRGRGKAPESVVAKGEIFEKDIFDQLREARKQLNEIMGLPEKSNFKHPYFGTLDLAQTIKFLEIHTTHHLKIIRDIIKD